MGKDLYRKYRRPKAVAARKKLREIPLPVLVAGCAHPDPDIHWMCEKELKRRARFVEKEKSEFTWTSEGP